MWQEHILPWKKLDRKIYCLEINIWSQLMNGLMIGIFKIFLVDILWNSCIHWKVYRKWSGMISLRRKRLKSYGFDDLKFWTFKKRYNLLLWILFWFICKQKYPKRVNTSCGIFRPDRFSKIGLSAIVLWRMNQTRLTYR